MAQPGSCNGHLKELRGAPVTVDATSNNAAGRQSTNSVNSGSQQQSALNTTSQPKDSPQSQAKKREVWKENGRKNGRRVVALFRASLQIIHSARLLPLWRTYRRRETSEEAKVPINRRPRSAYLATVHHLVGIAIAVTIVALNATGLWVGKELRGKSGHDTEKLLALQFAAKLHELVMFSSLSRILFSTTITQLVFGDGLPFGAITAGLRYSEISYLWSDEFIATLYATFRRKYLIIPAIIICTLLGVSIGPSSATAIRPTLGDWPAGETSFWLNATVEELWPSNLTLSLKGNTTCTVSPHTCGGLSTWTTLADNFFKYWGHEALGNIRAMPESVQIPGEVSIRTLNTRFRGPFTLYQPKITTATIQPAVIADVVNTIRQIWLRANGVRCYFGSDGIRRQNFCSYQDINWSVNARQPAVYVACHGGNSTAVPKFPTLASGTDQPTLVEHAMNFTGDGSGSASSIRWVDLPGPAFARASVGALVTPIVDQPRDEYVYACSIDAQWANVTIESSFLGLPYMVNGVPPNWYQPQDHSGGQYHGRHVSISPAWAALVNPPLVTSQNSASSPFDMLFAITSLSDGVSQYMAEKIEAILAVLLADRMARVSAEATLQGAITDTDQVLQISGGQLFTAPPLDSQYHRLTFHTAVTGYAYGLRTTSGIVASTLVSIIILLCYVAIAVTHVLYTLFFSSVSVHAWESVTELLALALHSDVAEFKPMHNTSAGIKTMGPLRALVMFGPRNGQVEMIFGPEGKGRLRTMAGTLEKDKKYA